MKQIYLRWNGGIRHDLVVALDTWKKFAKTEEDIKNAVEITKEKLAELGLELSFRESKIYKFE